MMVERDHEIQRLFDGLRAQDAAGGPFFESLVTPDALKALRRRQRRRRLGTVATVASLAIVAAATLRGPDSAAPVPDRAAGSVDIDLGTAYWHAPTDFLLDTPGRELLRGVPTFTTNINAAVMNPADPLQAESTSAAKRRSDS